jgi:predicted MFS family arabinose efflux permease
LLSWGFLGASGTYFVIAAMFVFVLMFTWRIPETGSRGSQGRSVFEDMKLGLRHVRSRPRLLHAIVSYYLLTMLGFSFFVLMPGFVKVELGRGTAEIGAMLGVAAAGGFVGSVIVASLADSKRAPIYLRIAGAVGAAGLIVVGLAPGLMAALVAMVFVGGGIAAYQTLNNSMALRLADVAYYGRVMGLMQVAWGLINLTSLPVGALADALGERVVLSGAGVALAAALVTLTLWENRLESREKYLA